MKKRGIILLLSLTLILSWLSTASAESGILDSMEFSGSQPALSLNDAVTEMLKDNAAINGCLLEIEKANITYERASELTRQGRSVYGHLSSKNPDYIINIVVPELNLDYIKPSVQRNYDATVLKLKAELEQSYYGTQQAVQAVEINKSNVDVANDLYNKTQKKFELGLVARQEVISSELNLIKARNEYNSSINTLKNLKMALNIKIGRNVMDDIKLKDELKYTEFSPGSIAKAVESAINSRNEIKAAAHNYEVRKLTYESEKQISEQSRPYKEAKADYDKAKRDLEDAKKNIEMEVRVNCLDIIQKQEEIKAGQKAVELSSESLKISQLSYEKGMATLTDAQKDQVAFQQAKLALSKSILDYTVAVSKFKDSIGIGRAKI